MQFAQLSGGTVDLNLDSQEVRGCTALGVGAPVTTPETFDQALARRAFVVTDNLAPREPALTLIRPMHLASLNLRRATDVEHRTRALIRRHLTLHAGRTDDHASRRMNREFAGLKLWTTPPTRTSSASPLRPTCGMGTRAAGSPTTATRWPASCACTLPCHACVASASKPSPRPSRRACCTSGAGKGGHSSASAFLVQRGALRLVPRAEPTAQGLPGAVKRRASPVRHRRNLEGRDVACALRTSASTTVCPSRGPRA